jgi:hypothetical protein
MNLSHEANPRAPCFAAALVAVVAGLVAVVSARDYAGSWNDGSRLATVEAIVDYHTLAIDRSIFVRPGTGRVDPYSPDAETTVGSQPSSGTQDRLLIDGHWYSDKSPLPALWLAGCYELLQSTTGLVARDEPRQFCYWMTLASSGLAYVVAVWSVYLFAARRGLSLRMRMLLAASLGLATLALPYARFVNNHLLLLGVMAPLLLVLDAVGLPARRAAAASGRPATNCWLTALAGALTGVGYSIDLGVGPVLVVCTSGLVAYRARRLLPLTCFAAAALPWIAAHHALNYAVGGTWAPANANPEYLAWPGSPFNIQNMTGGWAHHSLGHFLLYAAALVFGKHGFLNHNLPLLLAVASGVTLWKKRPAELPELAYGAALSGGVWLLYAAASNNYSGSCCSVRWFVPLLAPGFYALAVFLRERPSPGRELAGLALCGGLLGAVMWSRGPWAGGVIPHMWPLTSAALVWLLWRPRSQSRSLELSGQKSTLRADPGEEGGLVTRASREAA